MTVTNRMQLCVHAALGAPNQTSAFLIYRKTGRCGMGFEVRAASKNLLEADSFGNPMVKKPFAES